MPFGAGQRGSGIEDGDASALVAVAALVVTVGGAERDGCRGDSLDRLAQGRLVVLDLDDQGDVGRYGDREVFFGNATRRG